MNIEGLDYNTQRPAILMQEYGREVQMMIEHAITLPTKAERQQCANTIITTMKRLTPGNQKAVDRLQTLWNHLAIMSAGRLDIDYPESVRITGVEAPVRPDVVPYPEQTMAVRHYGKALAAIFDMLKTMPDGEERNQLIARTANQMRRCLILYGHGSSDGEKIADDLARYTDGVIQLDYKTFRFERFDAEALQQPQPSKKKKKKRR